MDVSISKLIVHCSDTPDHLNIDAQTIHNWHRKPPFTFDGIGYHRVIRRNGTIELGRPEYWTGAHTKGHNTGSLGVCLIGRKHFTPDQMDALAAVIQDWRQRFPIRSVTGHYTYDPHKTCPNFNVEQWLKSRQLHTTRTPG